MSAEMILQMSSEVVRLLEHGAKADCRMLETGGIALSGEAAADLNMVFLTSDASRQDLDAVLAAVSAKGLDALLVVEDGADTVRGWAAEAGLTEVGQMPLMQHDGAGISPSSAFTVRIADPDEVDIGNRLAAAAFGLDEGHCRSAIPASALASEGYDLWLAEDDGTALGSGLFIRTGDHVGIYTMSTPAENQRRGVGMAVLTAAMAHYRERGVKLFTLGATEKGYPLYERIGFRTVSQPHIFVIGASTQFPGQ